MENEELDDFDYFKGKKSNRTYISKRLVNKFSDGTSRDLRIVSKVIDPEEMFGHVKLINQLVLRRTTGGRYQMIAKVYEDERGVFILSLQRYTANNGNPHELCFSFVGNEIKVLKNFIDSLKFLDFSEPYKARIEDEQLEKARELLMNSQDLDLLIELAQKNITKRDVVALAYRKEQLEIFNKLKNDDNYFLLIKSEWNKAKNEDVWQEFFERNPWIFGYGLNIIFNEPLQNKKLQQVVDGYSVVDAGKRVDGLLKTRGIINSLCLVELKTHRTKLLKQVKDAFRPDCWQLSDELNGGISQIQKTAQKTVENIGIKLNPRQDDGSPTGEEIFIYQPKSYLVIGDLSEFITEHGINKEKYSSFEIYRRNITSPEIITFDELYERAKFIVHNNEQMSQ